MQTVCGAIDDAGATLEPNTANKFMTTPKALSPTAFDFSRKQVTYIRT